MRLKIEFHNINRPRDEIVRLETIFRDAMLNYCPSIEKLSYWQERGHFEYLQAKQRGWWATYPLMTKKNGRKLLCCQGLYAEDNNS